MMQAATTNTAQLTQLRMYVPIPDLPARIGDDVNPLTDYVKALTAAAGKFFETNEVTSTKGLLIAVGVKHNKKSRVWVETVEGKMADGILRRLERNLETIEPIAVRDRPFAFGMQVNLRGQKVKEFPKFPAVWLEAAKKTESNLLIPPDDVFKVIWPD
jgi:hypothetical protein